jgi:hypothetical protein
MPDSLLALQKELAEMVRSEAAAVAKAQQPSGTRQPAAGSPKGSTGGRWQRSMSCATFDRGATRAPGHFQLDPEGRGSLAILPRCSLGQDRGGYCRFARALKNRQIADGIIANLLGGPH